MFSETDLTQDAFLSGKLQLWQPLKGYRAATDPVLLAAACPATPGQSVLDLGCGAGTAALCLAARVPGLRLAGLELQPAYAELASRNAYANGIEMLVETGDLADMPAALRANFDHVIANPPYYARSGSASPEAGRDTALRVSTPLAAWVEAASRRLAPGGCFTLICSTEGLPEVLGALGTRLGSVTVLPLCPRAGRPASRILLRARKGGRSPFRLLAPLIIHNDGQPEAGGHQTYTAQINAILRDGACLSAEFC